MTETCDPLGNCRDNPLCPCDCGACVVHCPTKAEGESWIDEEIRKLEMLRTRRHAFLQGEVPARVPNRGLFRSRVQRSATDLSGELAQATRATVLEVLAEENGNRMAAARRLGIQPTTLYRMLKRWNVAGGNGSRPGRENPEVLAERVRLSSATSGLFPLPDSAAIGIGGNA